MCVGVPKAPDVPTVPERQSPKQPTMTAKDQLTDRDRRRRGYAAMMFAPTTGAAAGTTNVTGV